MGMHLVALRVREEGAFPFGNRALPDERFPMILVAVAPRLLRKLNLNSEKRASGLQAHADVKLRSASVRWTELTGTRIE